MFGLFQNKRQHKKPPNSSSQSEAGKQISKNIDETVSFIQGKIGNFEDLEIRHFHIFGKYSARLCYLSEQTDINAINADILKPLMYIPDHVNLERLEKDHLLDTIVKEVLYHGNIKIETKDKSIVHALLLGESILLIDEIDSALRIGTIQRKERGIESPQTEQVILGPREGFVEQLGTNISLLRYRLPTSDFTVKMMKVGKYTKTKVAVCYLKGVARSELVQEVEKRLSKIDIDIIMDSGTVEQLIEDNHWSPFPQIQSTERPDRVVGNLIEGRVALLTQGSPFALILPVVFNQFYQTTEDYTNRLLMGNFIRLARIIALVFSLIFPSLYVSFIAFNPELLPTEFAVAVAGGRAGVPFPAVIEVFILEVSMEVLREATVRLPQQVGGALSIVGVLIVGEAAVQAGFASPITVVVIALTTIGSFATPVYTAAFALRMLRFPILFLAGVFGLYGVVIGVMMVFNHMLSLRSFGVPYMSPVSPPSLQGFKDVVFRGPLWSMKKRPFFLVPQDKVRVGHDTEELEDSPSITDSGNQEST